MVNIPAILNSPDVMGSIPSIAKGFVTPTIVYNLDQPISSKIFNFNKFTTNFNIDEFLINDSILPCECENSCFTDKNHKHYIRSFTIGEKQQTA